MRKEKTFFITEDIDTGQKNSLKWVEDSYAPGTIGGFGKEFLNLSISKKKIRWFLVVLIFAILILMGKSFYLQGIRGGYYFDLAENNRLKTIYTKAHRGIIYDRNGDVLAQNVFGFSLLITPAGLPSDLNEREVVIQKVASIFNIEASEIKEKIDIGHQYYFQPIIIKTGIGYEQAMALMVASVNLKGVSLEMDSWREYLDGEEFSHLIGYVGKISEEEYEVNKREYLLSDNIGKTGLEKYYENYLKGEHGIKQMEIDSLGREKKIISEKSFVPGCDLYLTIDAGLQKTVYEILQRRLSDKKAAVVIISNPQNGEILSLVDYPTYDNNLFATGISYTDYNKLIEDERNPLFNRSILGEYPSGSTIKPLIAAAALEEGVVTPNTSFDSYGGLWVMNQWFFPDWKAGGHGVTNIYKALAESVNTYFYYIGGGYGDFEGLGVDRINPYLKLFGLGEKTNIDLIGEKDGLIPNREWKRETKNEVWYIGDTYHLAIGQGDLLVTPIQVSSYNSTIANGGTIYRPHLLKNISYPDKEKELITSEIVRDNFIKEKNINVIQEGMRQAVTYGSAVALSDLPIKVAGKTGTAQWHNQKENHAWFNAFAPYDNPNFAITVLVEEGGEGSSVAVPIAKEIMQYWFTQF